MSEVDLENSNVNPVNNTEAARTADPSRSQVKFDLWERKLLDLSTRNSLLNLRIKGSSIPLFVPECSNIEDLLAQEKSFSIISRGAEEAEEEEETKDVPDAIKPAEELENVTAGDKTPVEALADETEQTEEAKVAEAAAESAEAPEAAPAEAEAAAATEATEASGS